MIVTVFEVLALWMASPAKVAITGYVPGVLKLALNGATPVLVVVAVPSVVLPVVNVTVLPAEEPTTDAANATCWLVPTPRGLAERMIEVVPTIVTETVVLLAVCEVSPAKEALNVYTPAVV